MILDINCKSIAMNNILYAVKNILNIIMIIAPILAIVSGVIMFTKLLQNPDDKKAPKQLLNTIKALVIIFFIPLFVNVTMRVIDNRTDVSACYNSAKKPSISTEYIPTTKEGKNVLVPAQKYEKGSSGQLDFSCKSSIIKAELSCQTLKIVEQHYKDFNSTNFKSYIAYFKINKKDISNKKEKQSDNKIKENKLGNIAESESIIKIQSKKSLFNSGSLSKSFLILV